MKYKPGDIIILDNELFDFTDSTLYFIDSVTDSKNQISLYETVTSRDTTERLYFWYCKQHFCIYTDIFRELK